MSMRKRRIIKKRDAAFGIPKRGWRDERDEGNAKMGFAQKSATTNC